MKSRAGIRQAAQPSEAFLGLLPSDLLKSMAQQGMSLSPYTRPRLVRHGQWSVRLVFRNRPAGLSHVVTFRMHAWLGEQAVEVLGDIRRRDASGPAHV